MAQIKFYAVAKGRVPGIYTSWDDCKAQTQGYPGAIFRSFPTFDEADEYLEDNDTRNESFEMISPDSELSINELKTKYNTKKLAISFVDGSFYEPSMMYSYGGIIIFDGKLEEFSDAGCDPSLVSMRNVAGEILGAKAAMEIAIDNNIPELNLFYDYEGIEKWCTGAWKANKEGTKEYKEFYDSITGKLKVNFIKVKGHTGVELNEKVDKLAKKALGLI